MLPASLSVPSGLLSPQGMGHKRLRFSLREISGGLGDLGTFIPLAASLVQIGTLHATPVLLFAGLANIATGVIFGQPIAVQPMKAMATIAIAERIPSAQLVAGGVALGALLLLLGISGVAKRLARHVPLAVVRGIQLGIGIKLSIKALRLLAALTWWGAIDNRCVALVVVAIIVVTWTQERFPCALFLLAAGLLLQLLGGATPAAAGDAPHALQLTVPTGLEWKAGIVRVGLPQLPLTLLNSVLAVSVLSEDLFPGRGVAASQMATSVGLMNLLPCFFGALPVCHGAGGLAAQHHFGGRTGGSVVFLGIVKVVLALTLGSGANRALMIFPQAVLAPMLLASAVALALPARSCASKPAFVVACATAVAINVVNAYFGVLFGLIIVALLRRTKRVKGSV